jgi:hypothetical protein
VREQARAWQGTAVTTLLVQTDPAHVTEVADLLRG